MLLKDKKRYIILPYKLILEVLQYYFSTTFMAVIEGIILVLTIRPGYWTQSFKIKSNDNDICMSKAVDTILDLLRNLFPENLVQACTQSVIIEMIL